MNTKDREIEHFRENVIKKYVTVIENKLKEEERLQFFKTKICDCCKLELPLKFFYKHPLNTKIVTGYCKNCVERLKKEYRKNKCRNY